MAYEEAAVRLEHIDVRASAERLGRRGDAAIAAFDFDKHTDRRLVDRDDAVVEREFLAVLLIPEPDVKTELAQNAHQDGAIADDGLHLFAHFHPRGLHGSFERQKTASAVL